LVAAITRTSIRISFLPAHAAKYAVLEDPEELGLDAHRHLRDIEQERPAVGELEASDALVGGAGERAALVAEDLALDQRFRNGGTVDGDEWALPTVRGVVNRPRDELFPGAALAVEEHGARALCGELDPAICLLHPP
jgi:hypothetical protein